MGVQHTLHQHSTHAIVSSIIRIQGPDVKGVEMGEEPLTLYDPSAKCSFSPHHLMLSRLKGVSSKNSSACTRRCNNEPI